MISEKRRNELCDLLLKYNQILREDTEDMTNEERVFLLESHIEAISIPLERFRSAPPDEN